MNYITLENISKSYGEKVLFENLTLRINKGDKIALIAKNGSGKSTLLRIISGEEAPEGEQARMDILRDLRIGFLKQDPPLSGSDSIWGNILELEHPKIRSFKAHQSALHSGNEKALEKSSLLMDDHKAWDIESTIHELFSKLKLKNLNQRVDELSGGQRKRVALGMMILQEPQMLILDEPTNHLDVEMIEWLEEYFQQPDLSLLMVTHDRYFLDRVCNEILEIYNGSIYKYKGNYSDFLVKKTAMQENESVRLDKTNKLLRKELEWIRKMPKARTTKNKARIDSYDDLKVEAAKTIYEDPLHVEIEMKRLGSKILEFRNVSFSFDDLAILKNFDYKFKKNDRVGIIGPNGVGKSTFVSILMKDLRPKEGKIIIGDTVTMGYYSQEGLQPTQDKRVIEIVRDVAEYIPLKGGYKLTAEKLLERFMFPREQQEVYYSQLSGGEKRRIYLLMVLMANPNFLILDEPTNDLDIVTLNVLEEFLLQFKGCLVIISHDRYMIDKLVDHIFVFEGDGLVKDYPGGYSAYAQWRTRQMNKPAISSGVQSDSASTAQNKIDFERRKDIKRLEKGIEKMEEKRSAIQMKFTETDLSVERLQELHKDLKKLEADIEEKEMEWMELVDEK